MSIPFRKLAEQPSKKSALNLVALMDIFTVLVFFLLFNVHEEQNAMMGPNISDLPVSAQAVNQFKNELNVQTLELPNQSQGYFDGQMVTLTDNGEALTELMKGYCKDNDKHSCQLLAIQAPPEVPYPFVNQFVELGRSVGFKSVYLVVTQK